MCEPPVRTKDTGDHQLIIVAAAMDSKHWKPNGDFIDNVQEEGRGAVRTFQRGSRSPMATRHDAINFR